MSPRSLTADEDLAQLAVCPECDGDGLIYDYTSPDPQNWWDSTCRRCWETGLISISEEAA